MPPRPSTCIVCNTALTFLQARQGPLCDSATCAWTHRSRPAHQRCGVCGRGLLTHEIARGACGDPHCQKVWLIDRPIAEREARRRALLARAEAWRDEAGTEHGLPDAADFVAIPIPSNPYHTTPLPPARRDALRAHLTEKASAAMERLRVGDMEPLPLVRERATSAWAMLPPASAAMQHVLSAACATCRGSCCSVGANHAFIDVDTMQSYIEQHPDDSLEQIIDAYMAPIAEATMSIGCIYQVEQACTLPRGMRSTLCNGYYCESLVELQHVHQHEERLRVFLAPDAQGQFDQGVFVEADLVTLVRRRAD